MPKYDYRCSECRFTVEFDEPDLLIKIEHHRGGEPYDEESGKSICPGKFKRVYAFSGAILKGGGFYRTDNPKWTSKSQDG